MRITRLKFLPPTMAFLLIKSLRDSAILLVCFFLLISSPGNVYSEEDDPETGGISGGGTGFGGGGKSRGNGFSGGEDPPEIVAKALECLKGEKQIYRECEETWRLTLIGELNIPETKTEEFCKGPCFSETHLVLNCIDNILHHFRFYNRATVRDIRHTLKAGCSYGPERGDFNVLDHIEDEENGSERMKSRSGPLIGIALFTIVLALLL